MRIVLIGLILLFLISSFFSKNCFATLLLKGSRKKGVTYNLSFRLFRQINSKKNKMTLFSEEESSFPLIITCTVGKKVSIQELDLSGLGTELIFHNECCKIPLQKHFFHIFKVIYAKNRAILVKVPFN